MHQMILEDIIRAAILSFIVASLKVLIRELFGQFRVKRLQAITVLWIQVSVVLKLIF